MMKKQLIIKLGKAFFSLPKSIIFNMVTFGIKTGIKCPILVSYNTKLRSFHRNSIVIESPIKPFMIRFGFGGSNGIVSNARSELCLEKGSKLIFGGNAQFAEGCSIRNSGILKIGKNSGMNKNSFISCYKSITIGEDLTAGWNVSIRDSDGHTIIHNGEKKLLFAPVIIGNKVWLCSYADILKGVVIGNNNVVSYRSLVVKSDGKDNVMLGGTPANIIQENIDWEF